PMPASAPPVPPGYQPPAVPLGYAPQPAQHPGQSPYQQPAQPQPPYVAYGGAQPGYSPQGYPVAPYPGSGVAPGQYVLQAGVGGLPIAAIIVSGIAFLIGWMPY